MKEITIANQAEFDALPDSFKTATYVYIKAPSDEWVSVSRVVANAYLVAWGSSHVEAWGSSHVVAWESSHVVARESSHVEAWGSSHVEAWGSSHVEAWGSSHVEAWGSSHVVAWGSSHVEAWANVSIKVQSKWVSLDKLKQFATAVCVGCDVKPIEKDDTATILVTPVATYTKEAFLDIYRENKNGKGIYLYKVVRDDYTDHFTGKIKYEIGKPVRPEKWDSDENRECGDGLHLSPTPDLALTYNKGRVLKCLVKYDDFVVYPHNITKVRCSEVTVAEEIKG
jgi:hypothetical protein